MMKDTTNRVSMYWNGVPEGSALARRPEDPEVGGLGVGNLSPILASVLGR
jgi:hypothetical protein